MYYIKPIADNKLVNIWLSDEMGRSPSAVGRGESTIQEGLLLLLGEGLL